MAVSQHYLYAIGDTDSGSWIPIYKHIDTDPYGPQGPSFLTSE